VYVKIIASCKGGTFFETQCTSYYISDNGINHKLNKTEPTKGLGVTFDYRLTFHADDIHENVNKAYSILGLIKRNFIYIYIYERKDLSQIMLALFGARIKQAI